MDLLEGIDVSRGTGKVDWTQVAVQADFAYTKATQGTKFLDPSFADNWFGMKDAGLPRGASHYFLFEEDPAEQASAFLDAVPYEPGDLPPALDLSDVVNVVTFQRPEEITQRAKTWLDAVEQATGRIPVLIVIPGSPAFQVFLNDPAFQRYPLWVMSFSRPDPQQVFAGRRWLFWLFRDDYSLAGVPAKVNLSRFNGSLADLLALSYEGMVQEALTGKVLFPIRSRFDESVAAGSTLVLRSAGEGTLQIVNLNTYQVLVQPEPLSFPGKDARLAASSAGATVAISGDSGVTLLSLGGWQAAQVSDTPARALAFSADFTRLASANSENVVAITPLSQITKSGITLLPQVRQARPVASEPLPANVTALAFSADGGILAAGLEDGRIALLDPDIGRVLGIYTTPAAGPVTALAFHPGQSLLAVGTAGGTALVDLRSQALQALACSLAGRELTPEERQVYGIAEDAPSVCR
jgi:lysozyme